MKKYKCPCCGYYTLLEEPPGTDEICKVCFWQDDNLQSVNPKFKAGPNKVSLIEAQANYLKIGAISEEFLQFVRKPLDNEKPQNQ